MALPIIPNIALGKTAEYCQLAKDQPTGFASAGLKWVLLVSSGLESSATLAGYALLSTLLAASNNEASFTGYSRLTVTAGDITIGSTTPRTVDITTDPSWDPTTVEAIGAIVLVFCPDTGGADSTFIPLMIDDAADSTVDGTPFTYQIASGGFYSTAQV